MIYLKQSKNGEGGIRTRRLLPDYIATTDFQPLQININSFLIRFQVVLPARNRTILGI